jgi:hypothetical protein
MNFFRVFIFFALFVVCFGQQRWLQTNRFTGELGKCSIRNAYAWWLLDTCLSAGAAGSQIYTANSTHFYYSHYHDDKCTHFVLKSTPQRLGECTNSGVTSIWERRPVRAPGTVMSTMAYPCNTENPLMTVVTFGNCAITGTNSSSRMWCDRDTNFSHEVLYSESTTCEGVSRETIHRPDECKNNIKYYRCS